MLVNDTLHIGEPNDVYIGYVDQDGTPDLTKGGLTNRDTGAAVNNATITAQVKDTAGTNVGSSVSMSYVATSDGHYLGTIPAATTTTLTDGTEYRVWVTASDGSVYRRLRYKAAYRGAE